MASRHPKRYQKLLQRLRQARMESGLSQVKVAAALKADQKYVSRVETGERRLDPIELQELAELYEQPLNYFLDGN
jgi:transcriptional regulator with XRE-family HTH domain